MSMPKGLLIQGDHLFLIYIFIFGRRRLMNNGVLTNPDLTLPMNSPNCTPKYSNDVSLSIPITGRASRDTGSHWHCTRVVAQERVFA